MIPLYIFSSAAFASISNLFFRKNLEKHQTSRGFLALYFVASLLLSIFFNYSILTAQFSLVMAFIGGFTALLFFAMLSLTAKSFQLGPPGLTLTFQNASCIFPGLLLCNLFGPAYGFTITPGLISGFVLIILGLYLSSRAHGKSEEKTGSAEKKTFRKWLVCVIAVMVLQGLILTIFQWRVLLFNCNPENPHWLLPWSCQECEDVWFIPAFFLVPTLFQLFLFWKKERRKFSKAETAYGLSSGVFNCFCTVLLLFSTKAESAIKKEMLFPLFTISVILLCNIWGKKIYGEKVNWLGVSLCILGVLVGLI